MIFAEFYHHSTGWNGKDFSGPIKLIPACGSDSVAILDGRFATRNHITQARAIARKRGYLGFTLNAGPRFTNARQVRPLEQLT